MILYENKNVVIASNRKLPKLGDTYGTLVFTYSMCSPALTQDMHHAGNELSAVIKSEVGSFS